MIGTGFDFGLWGALIKKILYIIGGMMLSGLVTVILFIKPGILVK
jgi:hypothetical protein